MRSLLIKISLAILSLLMIFTAALAPVYGQGTDAFKRQACQGATQGSGGCGSDNTFTNTLKKVANIMIYIVGAIAVLMLIIGGLRYVLSGGDSAGVEGAKNTMLYAIIGLVVAFLAYAIVNFVIGKLGEPAPEEALPDEAGYINELML